MFVQRLTVDVWNDTKYRRGRPTRGSVLTVSSTVRSVIAYHRRRIVYPPWGRCSVGGVGHGPPIILVGWPQCISPPKIELN